MASELNDDDLVDYDEDEGVDDAKPADDAKKCAPHNQPSACRLSPMSAE